MRLRIKEIRKARGLTTQQLADLAGMSQSYVSDLENGKKQLNARRMEAIAKALEVTPADLIGSGEEDPELMRHLDVLRQLPHEDREAVIRHARGLLRDGE